MCRKKRETVGSIQMNVELNMFKSRRESFIQESKEGWQGRFDTLPHRSKETSYSRCFMTDGAAEAEERKIGMRLF